MSIRTLQQLKDAVKSPLAKRIVERIAANQEEVVVSFLSDAAFLNSKDEWDMDDNFNTTEGIVEKAASITAVAHPEYGNAEQRAWQEIAMALGYDADTLGIEPEDDEDEDPDEEDPDL